MCSSRLEGDTPSGCALGGWLLMSSSWLQGEHARCLRARRMAFDVFYLAENEHARWLRARRMASDVF